MSDTDKTVAYAVDANAEGFIGAMQRSRAAAQESAKGIEAAFQGLGGVFKGIQGAFSGMLGVFAGGAAFAAAINVTKEWGAETGKLSKQLQITAGDATAYQVAAKGLGIDVSPLRDQFWGERNFSFHDPDGYQWSYGQQMAAHPQ